MNAKFEKWISENGYDLMAEKPDALRIWKAALQSLEVTPELVTVAARGICKLEAATCNTNAEDEWTWYGDTYNDYASAALTAVFNAIKEQAK